MMNNIKVEPSGDAKAVSVKTEVINDEHIPVYLAATSDGELVTEDNPTPIHIVETHNRVFNKAIHQHTATETTLTAATISGTDYEIEVADATGFLAGDYLHINTTSIETTHPQITNITNATGPSTFTLDRRLDGSHSIGDTITKAIINIASQNGTMAAPQEYFIAPESNEVVEITRLLFEATHDSASDLGNFLSIPALANGCALRAKINGQYGTFTNWKRCGNMKTDMFNVEFDGRSGGQGAYGTSGRGTFTRAGVVIRLNGATNDRIELYVQDTLTGLGLNTWTMKFQGYYL